MLHNAAIIWVPQGDARDRTRDPTLYDGVAEYLWSCGAARLDEAIAAVDTGPVLQPELL